MNTQNIPINSTAGNQRVKAIPSRRSGVDLSVAIPLLVAHGLGIALAPFTFTWSGFCLMLIFSYVYGLGVTAGAHRLFTHASYKASKVVEWTLAIFFLLSAQGSLYRWVRDHFIHHRFSDQEGDPHSPLHEGGFWHAQFSWLWKKPPTNEESRKLYETYTPTLKNRPWVRSISNVGFLTTLHLVNIVLMYALGALYEAGTSTDFIIQGWFTGVSWVIWGVFLRIVYSLHATNLVNSASHLWGYQSYEGKDDSRNNWWVAILAMGEGWHNNHHNKPAAANQGFHKWWEFDFSFIVLLILGALGQVKDLRVYRAKKQKTELWFPSNKND